MTKYATEYIDGAAVSVAYGEAAVITDRVLDRQHVSPVRPKASDIPDVTVLRIIERKTSTLMPDSEYPYPWATSFDVEPEFPDFPWKVVHAKVSKLIRRGLLDGCDCGCRGDWSLTEKGRTYLAERTNRACAHSLTPATPKH